MALHCQECGFVNSEGANYCQKCGAYIGDATVDESSTTLTYTVSDTGEFKAGSISELANSNASLVIRVGGGRVGESFPLKGDKLSVGRRPTSDIFLDDITVSRDHAVITYRNGSHYIDDAGSLNGTYVNRQRIDSHKLEEGDELQVGKYRLAYHEG